MIMGIIWKRINDTGKNWRHVYKALTVLEYLIAHGSERVIDEIKEHAYQISTLSDFQYIDSSGRDQGNNVRKKSQSIVVLVNDKERVQEVRQKAATSKDKYRNTSMANRPGAYSSPEYGDRYEDDRYGNRQTDRHGYGKETDFSNKDDGRYASYGDSYDREGNKYNRDYGERYGRDGPRDDDYKERGLSTNDYDHGSRIGSADHERDVAYEDSGEYSSRESGARTDDRSQDGSITSQSLEYKNSEQNFGAPPSYEQAVNSTHSSTNNERDGKDSIANTPGASSPPTSVSPSHATIAVGHSLAPNTEKEANNFNEFDPRGSFSAAPATSNGLAPAADKDVDLLGSLSDSFSSNLLLLVPSTQPTTISEATPSENVSSGPTNSGKSSTDQTFDDPFGDGLFKAVPSADSAPIQQQPSTSDSTGTFNSSQSFDTLHPTTQKAGTEFGSSSDSSYMPSGPSGVLPLANSQSVQHDLERIDQDIDILADILPPSISSSTDIQNGYPGSENQSVTQTGLQPQALSLQPGLPYLIHQNAPQNSFQAHHSGFLPQVGMPSSQTGYLLRPESAPQTGSPSQSMAFHPSGSQPSYPTAFSYQMGSSQAPQFAQPNLANPNFYGTHQSQVVPPRSGGSITQNNVHPMISSAVTAPPLGSSSTMTPLPAAITASTGSSVAQPAKDKFETKSSVWADTLSRGLVNLNISGSKTNPLADIGVDFDAINRKEKRIEKPTTASVTSTVTMGKAMGSGSGLGRAGAGSLRPPPNSMMDSRVNMGPGAGMNMVGGYGQSQPMWRGMGIGFGQVNQMQQPAGFPPGTTMPGGYYNPMMGSNIFSQRPNGP